MVGWLRLTGERHFRPTVTPVQVLGYPLAEVSLPNGDLSRRLKQGAKALSRRGIHRVVTAPGLTGREELKALGLEIVDPLPLCMAKARDMALFLLKDVPLRERRVALRSDRAGGPVWELAHALCPETAALFLDVERGEAELADSLRRRYGAAPRLIGQEPPQLTLEFSPGRRTEGRTLKLWGEPDLGGLRLCPPGPVPPDLEELPLLTLLWEAGRVRTDEIPVAFALDRTEESPYNTQYL